MAYTEAYNTDPVVALEGMIADTSPAVIISRTVETAALGFGKPAVQGAADHGCDGDVSGAADIIGISVRSQATPAESPNEYPVGDTASLMRKGVIWAKVTDAGGVVAGDPVWLKLADGTYSNADVGSSGSIKLAGCVWETSAANGALARMRVNLDVPAVAGAA